MHSEASQIVFTGVAPRPSLAQRGMARIRMLVLALGHYLQGEAWLDLVKCLVVEHDFAMFRLSFGFIVSCRHAWPFGVRTRYRMTYTLIRINPLIRWYRMTSTNKTRP